jgi:hypothetical protein
MVCWHCKNLVELPRGARWEVHKDGTSFMCMPTCMYCKATYELVIHCITGPTISAKRLKEISNEPHA